MIDLKEKIKIHLQQQCYGYIPKRPEHLKVEKVYEDRLFRGGRAILTKLKLIMTLEENEASFFIYSVIPTPVNHNRTVLYIQKGEDIEGCSIVSDCLNKGAALFILPCADIASDDANFKAGCAALLTKSRRKHDSPGKMAMWAFGAMRVVDYITSLPAVNDSRIFASGDGKLAEAAMLAAAFDERIFKATLTDAPSSPDSYDYCQRYSKNKSHQDAKQKLLSLVKTVNSVFDN